MCAKSYQNIVRVDKVITKIKRANFFASQCKMVWLPDGEKN